MSYDVLENDAKFTKNACVGVSFIIKLQDGDLELYLKKRLHHRSFPENYAKLLITAF